MWTRQHCEHNSEKSTCCLNRCYSSFKIVLTKITIPTSGNSASPMYRQTDKADITHYHPISLVVNVSKVFERVTLHHLYPKIERELVKRQYGFRDKRSAVLQLLMYLNEIYQNCDKAESDQMFVL